MYYLERTSNVRESRISTEEDPSTNDCRECPSISCDRITEVVQRSVESLQSLYGQVQSLFEENCCNRPRGHERDSRYEYMVVRYASFVSRNPSGSPYLPSVFERF